MSASETEGGLAPVTPIFAEVERPEWRSTWGDGHHDGATNSVERVDDAAAGERELAERNLMKRLRTHSLSIVEARQVIGTRALTPDDVEAVLARFIELGYLDDAALADQLVHAAVDRKGQGRRAIAQTLAKRGVARDASEAALAALPDDDRERALDVARSRARSVAGLDRDTALRRLSGQLARRGYGGSLAFDAARQALDELHA